MTGRRPHHTNVMGSATGDDFRISGTDASGLPGANWTTCPEHFKKVSPEFQYGQHCNESVSETASVNWLLLTPSPVSLAYCVLLRAGVCARVRAKSGWTTLGGGKVSESILLLFAWQK